MPKLIRWLLAATAALASTCPAPALGAWAWSAPAPLGGCPALEGAHVIFPSESPSSASGPGAVVWRTSASCPGGKGPRVARISSEDLPGAGSAPSTSGGRLLAPGGALAVAAAPHGEILIAAGAPGSRAAVLLQGAAGGPFAPLAALAGTRAPLALSSAFLGDVALLSPAGGPAGALRVQVERHYARTLSRDSTAGAGAGGSPQALALALDYRTDALAVWARASALYARDLPASGAAHPPQRLASLGAHPRVAALLSDDDRGIVAWSQQRDGETTVYLDRSGTGVRFGSPQLIERFRDPDGVPAPSGSPALTRLSSESVMLAWNGVQDGHWVVRTAAVDLLGMGPASTISTPGQDALLSALAPGPDDDALVLWSQPQAASGASAGAWQSIYAARGFDAYPDRTIFGAPEQLAGPGPNSDPTVAVDPADDRALAVWLGEAGGLEYSLGGAP